MNISPLIYYTKILLYIFNSIIATGINRVNNSIKKIAVHGGDIMAALKSRDIKVIIGLGNPGQRHYYQRHSIGFRILDALAEKHHVQWQDKGIMKMTMIILNSKKVYLVKPMTYMNSSGDVISRLAQLGIKPQNMLVVHDELEKPFGSLAFKIGGSHRGHNGLRSIMMASSEDFARFRFGIGRPPNKEDVPDYVLSNFDEPDDQVQQKIDESTALIETIGS